MLKINQRCKKIFNIESNKNQSISSSETQITPKKSSWKDILPIALAHHPNCDPYKNHTIPIGKFRLCIGCFIGYPSAFLAAFLGSDMLRLQMISISYLFLIGILLMQVQFLSFTSITQIRWIKIIQKMMIGFGGGFATSSFYYWFNFPIQQIKLFFVIFVILFLATPVFAIHGRNMKHLCNQCPNKWKEGICPPDFCLADRPKYEIDPITHQIIEEKKDLNNSV